MARRAEAILAAASLALALTVAPGRGADVNARLRLDPNVPLGADPVGRLRLYAPDPVDPGSSVSHWDSLAEPDLLMEPFIAADVPIGEIDLTLDLLRDIGWSPGNANVVVHFGDSPGEGFFAAGVLGQQRRAAIEHVAAIWGGLLQSSVPIHLDVTFDDLECGDGGATLAQAGPNFIYESFSGADIGSAWYPGALAESLSGANLSLEDDANPDADDIEATFNSAIDDGCLGAGATFDYSLSGTSRPGRLSFVNVALHEVGHGLGFVSLVNESTGANPLGLPDIWSFFTRDNGSGLLWHQMTNAQRVASAKNTGRLVWDGPNVNAAGPAFLSASPVLQVDSPASVRGGYEVSTAAFGPPLQEAGVAGRLVLVDDGSAAPREGCQSIVNAAALNGQLALVSRGNCNFTVKVKNAQNAGAVGVVIVNNVPGAPIPMGGTDASIAIPVGMVRQDDGERLAQALVGSQPAPTPTRTATPPAPPSPTPTPPATPAPPSKLEAEALTQSAVLLQWTDGSNNESELRIEAKSGAGAFVEVATAPANTVFATVEELAAATTHTFRVRARNAAGFSAYSNTVAATTAAGPAACAPGADTACLLGGQFRITGVMKNFASPPVAFENQVMSFPGGRAESDQAVFFESFEAGNFEVAVKMTDACSLPPGHPLRFYWAFFGGLTDQRTDMAIRDTVTGEVLTWTNPAGHFPTTVADTMAFPCASPGAAGACARGAQTACLIGGRFEVTGTMRSAANEVFVTRVIEFPQDRAETDQAVFFQSFEPGNFEVGVKMVDACSLPAGHPLRHYWIFYGGLTNADTEVRAIQVATGQVDVWRNPPGTLPTTEGRTLAFPCP